MARVGPLLRERAASCVAPQSELLATWPRQARHGGPPVSRGPGSQPHHAIDPSAKSVARRRVPPQRPTARSADGRVTRDACPRGPPRTCPGGSDVHRGKTTVVTLTKRLASIARQPRLGSRELCA